MNCKYLWCHCFVLSRTESVCLERNTRLTLVFFPDPFDAYKGAFKKVRERLFSVTCKFFEPEVDLTDRSKLGI
jgi:hypothetical protein